MPVYQVHCSYCGEREMSMQEPLAAEIIGKEAHVRLYCWTCNHETTVVVRFGGAIALQPLEGFCSYVTGERA